MIGKHNPKNDCNSKHYNDQCDDGFLGAIKADLDVKVYADVDLLDCGKLLDADVALCLDADLSIG